MTHTTPRKNGRTLDEGPLRATGGASTLRVTAAVVAAFARASGDVNPLHTDAVYARKTAFGRPVVHGALTVLHALAALPRRGTPLGLHSLKARFHAPVFPDTDYDLAVEERCGLIRVQVRDGGQPVADVDVHLADRAPAAISSAAIPPPSDAREARGRGEAAVRGLNEVHPGDTLDIPCAGRPDEYASLLERIGADAVSTQHAVLLGWASYVAGMELPGRQALVTGLTVHPAQALPQDAHPEQGSVEVTGVNAQHGLVRLHGRLADVGGVEVSVLARRSLPEPDAERMRALLGTGRDLDGRVALVVGGSRGLGASVVQGLAVRGAQVYATYQRCTQDAERVRASLAADAERVRLERGDAADTDWFTQLGERIRAEHGRLDLLVLNACPPFQPMEQGRATRTRADEYTQSALAMVSGPLSVLADAIAATGGMVVLVSSTAVTDTPPGWQHYAAAKRACESLLATTVAEHADLSGVVVRPARMATGYAPGHVGADSGMPTEPVAAEIIRQASSPAAPGTVALVEDIGPAACDAPAGPDSKARLAVAASFSIDPLTAPLKDRCRWLGLGLDVKLAPYGQVFQELLIPDSTLGQLTAGCAVVLLRFDDWPTDDIERNVEEFASAVRVFAGRSRVPLLVQICPAGPSSTETDLKWERRLSALLDGVSGVHLLSVEDWHGGRQVTQAYDATRLRVAHIPYTPDGYAAMSTALVRAVHALLAPPFKVLVLDCDNTLWQGVAGEDGPDGVVVTDGHRRLQEWAVELRSRGILVCLASKNDPQTIEDVFRLRGDMPLRPEHITAEAVSWEQKSATITRLAGDLQLGLDSFVFLDDNPVEVAQVRASCPGVLAVTVPSDPARIPALLDRLWAFDRLVVTDEDRKRSQSYRANRDRSELMRNSMTFADFFEGLQLRVDIGPAAEADLGRVAQLTQRTNQFNVSTVRRQEAELRALLAEPGAACDLVRVSDRFGDYGIVGAVIYRTGADELEVDTLLLSCRTLGRGVEHRLLAHMGQRAESAGVPVRIVYYPTPKNAPARLFLDSVAGERAQEGAQGVVEYVLAANEAAAVRFRPQTADIPAAPAAKTTGGTGPVMVDATRLTALARLAETADDSATCPGARAKSVTARPVPAPDALNGQTPATPGEQEQRALSILVDVFADIAGLPAAELGPDTTLAGIAVDSLGVVEATVVLEQYFGTLGLEVFYQHRNLGEVARALGPAATPAGPGGTSTRRAGTSEEIAGEVDRMVADGVTARQTFEHLDQEQVDHIVNKASVAALGRHIELAAMAVEETGCGVLEDKAVKNIFASEHIANSMAGLKTAGVIYSDDLTGVVEIAEPVGVICAITPMTNPTSTVVFKALIALKTRNPIIFAFHHLAPRSGAEAARIVRDAAIAAGAPKNCVQWVERPAREVTRALMHHDGVALILATGGNEVVKAAHSAGKPAIGVGAGNAPAYIAPDADIKRAVNDIVLSKAFDNGMNCASEQTVIVDESIRERVIEEFRTLHAHRATPDEKRRIEELAFGATAGTAKESTAVLNPAVVGKSPQWIAERAGFTVPDDTSVILAEVSGIGAAEPLTREKPFPVIAVLQADDVEQGLCYAEQSVRFHGDGHTAAVHTRNETLSREFGSRVKAVRIIWNAPAALGGIGDVYNALLPSLTLGCGSYGRNSVSDNVTAVNLINIRRIARRNNNIQWFKVPPKIYFEPNSIQYLAQMQRVTRVTVVTGPTVARLGQLDKVLSVLHCRPEPVAIQVIDFVEPEPTIEVARRGAAMMRQFQPDTIVAIGGGSSLDAAKVMWLWYEHPDVSFDDMREKFFDIRKRAFTFPELGERARLVCVPTTSGSGSEVTPFAVITDTDTGRKYPLADYALTPSVAIVDPTMVGAPPAHLAADTGFDALTHATEAYVSVFANDFTDGLCLQAIKLIFGNLERSVRNGARDPEAQEKMHNASAIAGMAFGNAFLGIVHAMSHTLGATFDVAHGRANALLLPHVIRYNGRPPTKLTGWPKYESYQAPERFQDIARLLGLPAATPSQAVEAYADAIEQLREAVRIPNSFQAAGVDELEFIASLPEQAMNAYRDQCAPTNPRMPVLTDMESIMTTAYYG